MVANSVANPVQSPMHFRPSFGPEPAAYMRLKGEEVEYVPARQSSLAVRLVGWLQSSSLSTSAARKAADPTPSPLWAWLNSRINRSVAEKFIQRLEAQAAAPVSTFAAKDIRSRAVKLPPQVFARYLSDLADHTYVGTQQNLDRLAGLRADLTKLAGRPALHCPEADRQGCVARAMANWRKDLIAKAREFTQLATVTDADVSVDAADVLPYLRAEVQKLQDARVAPALAANPDGASQARQAIERTATTLRKAADDISKQRFALTAKTDPERRAIVMRAAEQLAGSYPEIDVQRIALALGRLATEPQLETRSIERALANFADGRAGQPLGQAAHGEHLAALVDAIVEAPAPAPLARSTMPPIEYDAYVPGATFKRSAQGAVELVPVSLRRSEAVRQEWINDAMTSGKGRSLAVDWHKFDFTQNGPAPGSGKIWVSPKEQAKNFEANRDAFEALKARFSSSTAITEQQRVLHLEKLEVAAGLPPELFALAVVRMLDAQATLTVHPEAISKSLARDEQLRTLFKQHDVPEPQQEALLRRGLAKAFQFEKDAFVAELAAQKKASRAPVSPATSSVVKSVRLDDLTGPQYEAWRASFVEEALMEFLAASRAP